MGEANAAGTIGILSAAQMQAAMAPLLSEEQLVELVRELAAERDLQDAAFARQHAAQHAALARQRATIAEHEATIADQAALVDRLRVVVERLQSELRARRLSRGEVPRLVGDLLGWRETRQLTQAQAADMLGLGRATIERAEAQDLDTPLGRALQRALIRFAEAMNAADTPPPPPPRAKTRKRSALLPV